MASDDDKWAKLKIAHAKYEQSEAQWYGERSPTMHELLAVAWNTCIANRVVPGQWFKYFVLLRDSLPILADNLESGEP